MTVMSLLALMLSDTKVRFKKHSDGTVSGVYTVLDLMGDKDIKLYQYLCSTIIDLSIIRVQSEYGGVEKVLEVTI